MTIKTSSIFTVSDHAELQIALSQARGGDTIFLEAGEYGSLSLLGHRDQFLKFDGPVTITSADPGNPAVFSALDVREASGLVFKDLHFDYTQSEGAPIWGKPFRVWDSTDISFIGNRFTGDVARNLSEADNGYPTGFGLHVRSSDNITISENEISGFFRGLVLGGGDNLVVTRNEIHGIRMDGMNFAGVQGVLIEGNQLHNFVRSPTAGDHSDMIQFWTKGTTRPSTDIVIRDNILDLGAGHQTQSIFMRNDMVDRGLAGPEMFYRDILIEGNVIVNGHLHGITVGEVNGLVIRNNTVLAADGGIAGGVVNSVQIPRISVATTSTDVTIIQNVTSSVNGFRDQADWTVADNVFVQKIDPNAPSFYSDMFVTSSLELVDGRYMIVARPDSEIVRLDAGAASTRAILSDAAFVVSAAERGAMTQVFDASLIAGQVPAGTAWYWSFGDGNTASGQIVTHRFDVAGVHQVTLLVMTPDGAVSTARTAVDIQASNLLQMGSDGTFSTWRSGAFETVASFEATENGHLKLGGPGITASVARDVMMPMLEKSNITLRFGLEAERAGVNGEVFRLQDSLIVGVNSRGELELRAWSSEGGGPVRLSSTGTQINSGTAHSIDITLADGRLSIWVDGKMYNDIAFEGTLAPQGRHALTFGNSWHDASKFFAGKLTEFSVTINSGAPVPEVTETVIKDDTSLSTEDIEPVAPEPLRAPNLQLGDEGITARLSRDMLQPFFSDDELDISFSLAALGTNMSGEVFRVTNAMVVDVGRNGAVNVRAWSSEGDAVRLVGNGVNVADGKVHDVDIRLADGILSLWVNGQQLAETDFSGTFRDYGRQGLLFGNPWHEASRFFDAELSRFEIAFDAESQIDAFTTWASLSDMPLM